MSEGMTNRKAVREKECGQAEWAGLFDGVESENNRDCNGKLSSGFSRHIG